MRAVREQVPAPRDASWTMLNRRLDAGIPFQWHHHPEFELTLTLNSRGQRFIGDHIGRYDDGDLVLVGSNLPHTWSSTGRIDAAAPHVALVLWFRPDWVQSLATSFAELAPVAALFAGAGAGLTFTAAAAAQVRPQIEALAALAPAARLSSLLRILAILAADHEAVPLASRALVPKPAGADRTRIDRVLDQIHRSYAGGVSIPALAAVAALSASGLNRLFHRHLRMTISHYVMRLRIGEACALLSGTDRPVGHVAADVGYASWANFNRQFKALQGVTPRAYRRQFRRG